MKNIFLLLLIAFAAQSQNPKADSLKRVLENHPQPDTIRVSILNSLAFEEHFSDPQASMQHATESGELSKRLNYFRGQALSYRHMGLALWTQANLSNSLDYFLKGLKIADSLNYTQIQADITGNIGLVYNGLGNYAQALHFFESSLGKQRQLKNRKREIIMLNNMGDCYYFQKDFGKALQTYRQSLELGITVDFLMETNNRNIGNVFEVMGSLDSALNHYKISQKLSDRFNQGKEKAMVRLSIASIYLKKGNYKDAEALTLVALKIALAGKYRAQLRDAYNTLSSIELAQGRYQQSLEHYKNAIAYRDSIQNLTETSRIASVRLEYEMQKKQLEINQLKADTQLKEKDLTLKNALLFFSIAMLILLGLFIFNVVKSNKLLKARNKEISRQQDELIALNEEIVAQREEVMAQRDSLMEKNQEIELVNRKMAQVNENLERLVQKRTRVLEEQNKKLSDYAFFNAHNLRAPLARVMGLVNLLMS
ncbi:MAG: tetratricopeptide repeat protein, partial [Bacteroidetes bacterium]|nr:tetratricopeptide repeat protein [Bacteroidota bacterium]